MEKLSSIRREYSLKSLDEKEVLGDPIDQFQIWLNEAVDAQVMDVNAMHLATVKEDGRPSQRVVLLKGIEDRKFLFFTNYQSNKGRELEKNPFCALSIYWPELERQIRIEGIAERVVEQISDEYFKTRPKDSQIGAWASPQSSLIENRSILEERMKKLKERFPGEVPRPHQWGGYQINPVSFEFWQGRESRLHDRIYYVKEDQAWKIFRLSP